MKYKSRQPRSVQVLLCEELEARRYLSAVTFSPRQIIVELDGAQTVYAADLDGDGDMDALSAAGNHSNKIAWHKNIDGKVGFGEEIVITTRRVGRFPSAIAADVDGDRDLDVLMTSFGGTLAWYENTDGKGDFGEENVITRRAGAARPVHAADVDGDGDVDVLSTSYTGDTLAWYENTDGKGSFGQPKTISSTVSGPSLTAADMDGDGDVDVLATSYGQKIVWFENADGKGTFGDENVITGEVIGPGAVQAADVDGDGDMDIIVLSDNKYAWYENTDGTGSLGPEKVIAGAVQRLQFGLAPRGGLHAADLDGDGDVDLLGNLWGEDKIVWYENTDGMGSFGPQQVLDEGPEINAPSQVRAADVDGDGDMDVLSSSQAGDHIAWYENLRITAGDANRDCQFDQLDIVQVLQAAKYLTGEPATFEEGDWNGDGVFDQLDIVEALQTGNYLQGPEAAHMDN